jgi:hypothetical protein
VIPVLAFWSANLIIYWSTWPINWKLFVAVGIGFILLVVFQITGAVPRTNLDLRAGATWMLPWLAGLALISYLGDYGGRGVIGFGTAIPVMFAFSVAIYVLALYVRLDPAQVERNVADLQHEMAREDDELEGSPS